MGLIGITDVIFCTMRKPPARIRIGAFASKGDPARAGRGGPIPSSRGEFMGGRVAWGLLLVRLVFGGALIVHGWQKVGAPTSWLSPFQPGVPAILQWLVCAGELVGGLALLCGLLTQWASLGIAVMMILAATFVHGAHPWVAGPESGPSKEPSLCYLAVAGLIWLVGPGRFSLDAAWARFRARRKAPAEGRDAASGVC